MIADTFGAWQKEPPVLWYQICKQCLYMEIKSDPIDYIDETVIDMEFSLPGVVKALTFRPENGDTMDLTEDALLISLVATHEDTVLFWQHIHGIALHQRVMRRVVKKDIPCE